MDTLGLFFGFRGRINRAKYWLALVILFAADAVVSLLGFAVGNGVAFQIVSYAVNFAIFISTIALGFRRLHDRDRSAWWLLLFYTGPFLVAFAGWALVWATAGSFGDAKVVALFLLRLFLLAGIARGMGRGRGRLSARHYGLQSLRRRSAGEKFATVGRSCRPTRPVSRLTNVRINPRLSASRRTADCSGPIGSAASRSAWTGRRS